MFVHQVSSCLRWHLLPFPVTYFVSDPVMLVTTSGVTRCLLLTWSADPCHTSLGVCTHKQQYKLDRASFRLPYGQRGPPFWGAAALSWWPPEGTLSVVCHLSVASNYVKAIGTVSRGARRVGGWSWRGARPACQGRKFRLTWFWGWALPGDAPSV